MARPKRFNTVYRSRDEFEEEMYRMRIKDLKKLPGMFLLQVELVSMNFAMFIWRVMELIKSFEWLILAMSVIHFLIIILTFLSAYRTRKAYFDFKHELLMEAL